jgi:SAM-dependent methyltransferase
MLLPMQKSTADTSRPEGWSNALVRTPRGLIQESGPRANLSDHATRFMIDHMQVPKDARAAEAGCGTGVLSIYMALSGARPVVGTDIDPASLEAARYNASLNRVRNVKFLQGSLLDPVAGPLDLVVALLPHKPAPRAFNPRYYGGPEGTALLLPLVDQTTSRLAPGGKLYLYLNSIANTKAVLAAFGDKFQVHMAAEKRRYFSPHEFDSLTPGMFDHLCGLHEQGIADFYEDDGGFYFMARIYEAILR